MAQYNTHNSNQWDALLSAISGGSAGQPITFDSTQWAQLIQAISSGGGGGGGGGSVTFDELEKTTHVEFNTPFTINGNFSDYDIIIFEMYASTQTYANQWVGSTTIIASDLIPNAVIWIAGGNVDRSIQIQIVSDNEYQILRVSEGSKLYGIYGIKF